MIIGGADRAMLYAIYGQFEREIDGIIGAIHIGSISLNGLDRFNRTVAQKSAICRFGSPSLAWQMSNRNDTTGHRLLADFGFEPDVDLVAGPNGAWQWARRWAELERLLANYFIERAEDE